MEVGGWRMPTCGCVEVEYLDDLGDPELVAHVADAVDVLLGLPGLEQLGGLGGEGEIE